MGDGKQALDDFNQALLKFQNLGERNGEALVLNDTGPAYAALGQKQKALDAYNQAIALWRTLGNRQGEALTLNNIGRLYNDLGEHQTALAHDRVVTVGKLRDELVQSLTELGYDVAKVADTKAAVRLISPCPGRRTR